MHSSDTTTFADRGSAVDFEPDPGASTARWLAVARLGSLRMAGGGFSIWMQLRGRTRVVAREGSFQLRPGEWLALDRDSAPDIIARLRRSTAAVPGMTAVFQQVQNINLNAGRASRAQYLYSMQGADIGALFFARAYRAHRFFLDST